MKKKSKFLLATAFVCVAVGVTTGCELPTFPFWEKPTSQIELNLVEESVELELFQEYDLQYAYDGEEALSWSVEDSSVVTVTNGKLVALKEGETTVRVQSGETSDVCTVKVNGVKTELLNVSLENPHVSLYCGETTLIDATVTYGKKVMNDVTFTYESFDASVASVSSTGVLTANSVGTTSVSVAVDVLQTTIGCILNVSVEKNGAISLDATRAELYALAEYEGETYKNEIQIQAAVTEKGTILDPNTYEVRWNSSDTSVAAVENGRVVAVGLGNATITATYAGTDGYLAEAYSFITVLPVTYTVGTTMDAVKTEPFTLSGVQDDTNVCATDGIFEIAVPVVNGALDFSEVDFVGNVTVTVEQGNVLFHYPVYLWTDNISSLSDLEAIRMVTGGHYRLTTDIDLTDVAWSYETSVVFNGVFDGGGYTLTNFSPTNCGLFDSLGDGAKIQNLNLKNAILSGQSIGCLATVVLQGAGVTIENVAGNIVNNGAGSGGLFGRIGANAEVTLKNNRLHIYASNTATTGGALVGCADSTIVMASDAPSVIYANINLCGNTAYSGYTNSASAVINQNAYVKPTTYAEILDKWDDLAGTKIALSESNVVKAVFFGKVVEELRSVFSGVLNGLGRTISNITFAKESSYGGFFYQVNAATFKNIAVVGARQNKASGGVFFYQSKGGETLIDNTYVEISWDSTVSTVGGVCGYVWRGSLVYSNSIVIVDGPTSSNGLITGRNHSQTTVKNGYALGEGTLSGTAQRENNNYAVLNRVAGVAYATQEEFLKAVKNGKTDFSGFNKYWDLSMDIPCM